LLRGRVGSGGVERWNRKAVLIRGKIRRLIMYRERKCKIKVDGHFPVIDGLLERI
jgi:hypothetical protein